MKPPTRSSSGIRVNRCKAFFTCRRVILGTSVAILLSGQSAQADGVWNNNAADNLWRTTTNWTPAAIPGSTTAGSFASTETATFSTAGGGTIDLGNFISIKNITFGVATGNANGFIIGDAGDTLNLSNTGAITMGTGVTTNEQIGTAGTAINLSSTASSTYAFTNNSTTSAAQLLIAGNILSNTTATASTLTLGGTNGGTISGNIGSTGGGTLAITKSGAGLWELSGTSSQSGLTTISAGTLQYTGTAAMSSTSAITMSNGATMALRVNTASNNTTTTFNSGNITLPTAGNALTFDVSNAGAGTGSVLALGGTIQTINVNSATNTTGTTINVTSTGATAGTLQLGAIPLTTSGNNGNLIFNPTTGNLNLTGTITGSANNATSLYFIGSGNSSVTGALAQGATRGLTTNLSGTGTVTLAGNASNSGGTLNVYNGTLNLTTVSSLLNLGTITFTNATPTFGTAGAITLNNTSGGTLTISSNNAQTWTTGFTFTGSNNLSMGTGAVTVNGNATVNTTASTLTVGALTLTSGVTFTKAGAGTLATGNVTFNGANTISDTAGALNLGTIARNGSASVDFTGTLANIGTTTTNTAANAIIGAWATVNGGTNFAVVSGGKIAAYTGTTAALPQTGGSSTAQYTLAGSQNQNANVVGNSVIISNTGNSQTLALGASNLIFSGASGGLLYAGGSDNNYAITGTGVIGGGTVAEFLVNTASGTTLSISAPIVSATATAGSFTKTGAGTLVLSGLSAYTGTNGIGGGTVKLGASQTGATGPLGAGTAITNVVSGATLDVSTFNVTVAGLGSNSGTITSSAAVGTGGTLTIKESTTNVDNLLTGSVAFLVSNQNRNNSTSLQFTNAANTFTGGLTVRGTDASNVTGTLGLANFNPAGGLQNVTTLNVVRVSNNGAQGAGTLTLDNGAYFTTVNGITTANNIAVTAGGGMLRADANAGNGGVTYSGSLTAAQGSILGVSNGFTANSTFTASMSAFNGTLVADTANTSSIILSGAAIGNANASFVFSGVGNTGNSTNQNGNSYSGGGALAWNGTGTPTISFAGIANQSSGPANAAAGQVFNNTATDLTLQLGNTTAIAGAPVFNGTIRTNGFLSATTTGKIAVTKTGANTQTLGGVNSYTGATTISDGVHRVNSTVAATSGLTGTVGATNGSQKDLTVADTSGLRVGQSITGTGGIGTNAVIAAIVSSTVIRMSVNGTASASITSLAFGAGSSLSTASNTVFNGGVLGLGGTFGNFTRSLGTAANQVQFTGSGGFAAYDVDASVLLNNSNASPLVWNSTANFLTTGNSLKLSAADADKTLDFQNSIDLNGAARTVQVDNGSAAIDAKLSGVLSGTGASGLTKTGAGTLQVTNTNTYAGSTNIDAGTLAIGLSGSISGSTQITNNATFDVSALSTFIVGSTQTLTNNATTTGGLSVSGTLKGSGGSVSGPVVINSGGTLDTGNSIGTMSTGALTFAAGATLKLEINTTAGTKDVTGVNGNFSLDSGHATILTISDLSPASFNGALAFLTYTGTWNGGLFTVGGNVISDYDVSSNPGSTSFLLGGNTYQIDYNYAGNSVALLAVPEPGAVVSLLGGFGVLLGLQRRRARARA